MSLVPMEGLRPSAGIPGFLGNDGNAILVEELPAEAYQQFEEAAHDPGGKLAPLLATEGIVLQEVKALTAADGSEFLLINGTQGPLEKWMGIFQRQRTILVIAQSLKANHAEAGVEDMMKSVKLDAPATREDKIAALSFRFKVVPPFHVRMDPIGVAVGLTVGPKEIDPEHVQPDVTISYETQIAQNLDALEAQAEQHITNPNRLLNGRIEARTSGTIAGLAGRVLSGTYDGEVNSPPRRKKFAMYLGIAPSGRSVVLFATADVNDFKGLEPAIDATAKSIQIKPGN